MLIRIGFAVALSVAMMAGANATAPRAAMAEFGPATQTIRAEQSHAALMQFLLQQVDDPQQLNGYRVAILAADGVDGFDLEVPRHFLAERGATVHVIAARRGASHATGAADGNAARDEITVVNPSGEPDSTAFDRFVDQVSAEDYDAIYLPGYQIFSDDLDRPSAAGFVQDAAHAGKSIFATGNSAVILLEAGLLTGGGTPPGGTPTPRLPGKNEARPVGEGVVHTSRDAFDMPALIGKMIATLLARPVNHDRGQ